MQNSLCFFGNFEFLLAKMLRELRNFESNKICVFGFFFNLKANL